MWKIPVVGLLCGLLLPLGAAAEVVCALGAGASAYNPSADQRPTSDAMEMARRMNAALAPICSPKCPQIAIFRNPTAPNAMLVLTGDDARFVYSPQFFQTVYDNYGEGAIIAIMAHVFGHALDEINPGKFGRGGTPELRADAWAGCTVAKLDLNSTALGEALTAVAQYPSPAHPGWPVRVAALRLGYTQCGGDGAKFDSAAGKR